MAATTVQITSTGTWDWVAAGSPAWVDVFVVAGGGGGGYPGAGASGGTGGGGNGKSESGPAGTAGTVNTGGGGGGASNASANGLAGGSGIVVVHFNLPWVGPNSAMVMG